MPMSWSWLITPAQLMPLNAPGLLRSTPSTSPNCGAHVPSALRIVCHSCPLAMPTTSTCAHTPAPLPPLHDPGLLRPISSTTPHHLVFQTPPLLTASYTTT